MASFRPPPVVTAGYHCTRGFKQRSHASSRTPFLVQKTRVTLTLPSPRVSRSHPQPTTSPTCHPRVLA
eukprot:3631435-Rhodomonas_salina.1